MARAWPAMARAWPAMARAWRVALVLLASLIDPAQGQGGVGSLPVEVCSGKFVAADDHVQSVCHFGYSEGKITGQIADELLKPALKFPHRRDDIDPMAHLPALSPDLCEIGAKGLQGDAVTQFLLRLAERKPSQQPEVLTFSNLRVNGPFNAPSATITHKLLFDRVVFCGPVDFSNAVMTRTVKFTNSIFVAGSDETTEGIFRADGLGSTADVMIDHSRVGGIILGGAKISHIGITESAFGHVSAPSVTAKNLAFHNSRQYQSVLTRTKAWLTKLKDDDNLYTAVMGEYPLRFFASNIDLWDIKLENLFYSDRLIVDGALTAVNAEISTVRLRMAVLPAVDFRRLNADRVELFGAELGKSGNRKDCEIDRAFRYDVNFVSFQGADISGELLLHPQPPEDEGTDAPQAAVTRGLICLNELGVGGDLDLSAVSAEQIDLRRTSVGATLSLASETYGTAKFSQSDSFLDMRGMQIREISMSGALVMPARLRMAQSRVGGYAFTDDPDANLGDANSLARLTTLIERIASVEERALAYQVFETSLRDAGEFIASSELSFLREYWLTRSMDWNFRRLTRHVAEILGGYGTKPVRTVVVSAIATVIGAAFAWLSTEGRWFLMRQALSHRALRRQSPNFLAWFILWLLFDALVLSLDRLIPLVSISRPHKDLVFRKQRWVRAYFALHAILGLLLAGTTIAAISKGIIYESPNLSLTHDPDSDTVESQLGRRSWHTRHRARAIAKASASPS